ncbi:MAG: SHOCT domain-containing protein [Sandarakinorhabdus sp.]|nr:SHOCT domain-containing protein [Sandarakinorhabdus sp.]
MTFMTFLLDVMIVFVFIMWFWLLITVMGDLFRRDDVGGFGKVLWVIFLVMLPYLGVFAYLLTQGGSMAQRNIAQADKARDQLRSIVGFSAADEIEKLDRLKAAGNITADEYTRLRARALG